MNSREENKVQYNKKPKLCKNCRVPLSYEQVLNRNNFCKVSCSTIYNEKRRKTLGLHRKDHKSRNCPICGKETRGFKFMFCEPNGKCDAIYSFNKIRNAGKIPRRDTIKRYLLLTRDHICACCKLSEWLDKPITLESHHINGKHDDNSDENLELICPNCHSFTDTYKGKNKGNGYKWRRVKKKYISYRE